MDNSSTENSPVDVVNKYMCSKNVPLSVRNISHAVGVKRRTVHAICEQLDNVSKVHPCHCGSGKYTSLLYISSTNPRWKTGTSNWID